MLIEVHNETMNDATGIVCLAQHSSGFNTQFTTNGNYGIFNISRDESRSCNVSLSALLDDDIHDDLTCAKMTSLLNEQFYCDNNQTCANASFDECEFFKANKRFDDVIIEVPDENIIEISTSGDDNYVSSPFKPERVFKAPGKKDSMTQDPRQDNGEQELSNESLMKLLLLHNFAIQQPKPNVKLIFIYLD